MDRELIIKQFGENLQKVRLEKGMTQTDLGYESGIELSHISKLENGVHEPGLVTIFNLAMALECRVDDLIKLPRK